MVVGAAGDCAIGRILATMARWVSADAVLRTGCTGADCRCSREVGVDSGRMLAVLTVSGVLELESNNNMLMWNQRVLEHCIYSI